MAPNDNNDSETIVDLRLFKAIGLYQLLSPVRSDAASGYRTALLTSTVIIVGVFAVQTATLYLTVDDFSRFAYIVMTITMVSTNSFKSYTLIRRACPMWRALEPARYAFTTSARHDPSELFRCRDAVRTVLRTFAALNYCALSIWLITPWFVHETIPITNVDGTVAMCRTSVLNIWTPLSENAYNSPLVFAAVYAFEIFICSYCVFIITVFDIYVMTMSFVLVANFRTVAARYQTLGRSGKAYLPILIYFVQP